MCPQVFPRIGTEVIDLPNLLFSSRDRQCYLNLINLFHPCFYLLGYESSKTENTTSRRTAKHGGILSLSQVSNCQESTDPHSGKGASLWRTYTALYRLRDGRREWQGPSGGIIRAWIRL
jgi:hypothetical protein